MRTRCTYVGSAASHAKKFTDPETGIVKGDYEGKGLYNKKTGWPIDMPQREELCAPIVMSDIPEHVAPDGTHVTSRSHRREVCDRNGYVPYEKRIPKGERESRPRGYANERYAKKRKTRVNEAAEEWMTNKTKKTAKAAGLTGDAVDAMTQKRIDAAKRKKRKAVHAGRSQ